MKKILSLILALMLLLLCLASCDSSKHEHITGDWEHNESGHWQPITCNLNTCNLEETPILDHVDDNNDNICDVCGYTKMLSTQQPTDGNTECVHTYGEWQYDETYHWCDWSCSLELCDIDTVGEHIDKDGDNVCDTCNYIILNCVHTYGEWQYNETHHWCDWSCSLNMCRIETTGEHFDEDKNGVCDKCGYVPPIDNADYVTIGTAVSDVMPPYAISCKIPTEYSTDNTNIPIILSFGLVEGCDADTDNYSEIVLSAENDEGQTIIIKRINISEILKSEYFVESVWDDNRKWIIDFNYTHKESFALPLSLFSGTSGQIHIGLYECSSTDLETLKLGSGAYIVLYYTRNESNISISVEDR